MATSGGGGERRFSKPRQTILPGGERPGPAASRILLKPAHYPVVVAALFWNTGKGRARPGPLRIADAWAASYCTLSAFILADAYGNPQARRKFAMSEPLVIVGNGMAAARLVDLAGKDRLGRYAVAVIGDGRGLSYNALAVFSSLLAGQTASHEIELMPAAWWRDRGVTTVKYGQLDARSMSAAASSRSSGEEASSSRCLCASPPARRRCGSTCPGRIFPASTPFATAADVDLLLQFRPRRSASSWSGGGLVGLEARYGLGQGGAPVTLVHLILTAQMERQPDPPAAALLRSLVERKGIRILLNASTARIHGGSSVEASTRRRTGGLSPCTP